ncbi:MAG: lysylphosphatidylglycerol synthase transmembrane domain-containing protein [Nanoarchaeota archaeon]
MKGIIFGILSLLTGIIILSFTLLAIGIDKIAEVFKTISLPLIFAFLTIHLVSVSLAVFRWKLILSALGHKIPFLQLLQYNIIGFSVGYITPVGKIGGAPARMVLLDRDKVPFEKGLASILIDNIVENTFDVLFGIIILSFFFLKLPVSFVEVPTRWRVLVLLGCAAILSVIIIFYYRMFTGKGVFYSVARLTRLTRIPLFSWSEKKLHDVDKLFSSFIRSRPKEVFAIFAISCLTWIILILQYKVALLSIGQSSGIFELLMIMGVLAVVAVIPVPAGLGVLEFGQAGLFYLLGLDPRVGIVFALLIRLKDFFVMIFGALFLFQIGLGSLVEKQGKKI